MASETSLELVSGVEMFNLGMPCRRPSRPRGTVVDWIAYSHLKQTVRDGSQLGKGDIRGVIAPEAANNAKEGGALIPTLLFGIPGSGNKVLLLGGFVLIGIEPGLDMVTTNLDLTYLMIWSLALANILGAGICIAFASQISRITLVPYYILAPVMICLIFSRPSTSIEIGLILLDC